MSRLFQTVIIVTGLFLGYYLSGRNNQIATECKPSQIVDVAIVGAGIAGISAAKILYEKYHIENVTILEARNYYGGRIDTRYDEDGFFIEFGAQWAHGSAGHPMMQFLQDHDLFFPPDQHPHGDTLWVDIDGKVIDPDIVDEIRLVFRHIREEEIEPSLTESVGSQLRRLFDEWLQEHKDQSALKWAIYEFLFDDECAETASNMTNLGTDEDFEFRGLPGNDETLIKGGWSGMIEKMIETFPMKNFLQLNSIVTSINWQSCSLGGDEKRVAIRTSDGRVISAQTAIVTLPLGVLKAGTVDFRPQLNSEKLKAIERLGYGCALKIFLYFNSQWWGDRYVGLNIIFPNANWRDDGIKVNEKLYKNENEMTWYRHLVSFNASGSHPLVMQTWASEKWAEFIEALPSDEVRNVIGQMVVKSFTNHFPNVEKPVKMKKSEWCTSPFSRGAYTNMVMGSRATDVKIVAERLPRGPEPILFFAGEHVSSTYWSTVHGAWETGVDAAHGVAFRLYNLERQKRKAFM